jgi:murein L,D-transpeptidase YafK
MGLACLVQRIYSLTFTPKILREIRIFGGLCLLILTLSSTVLALGISDRHRPQVKLIPDPLISLSAEDGPAYAILVEKATQGVMVYEYQDTFSLRHKFPCSTGEVTGSKQKSGDRKTPEGIYFFTKASEKKYLGPIYGSMAFVMDYPNFLDRKFERGGNNIWLHGSDKPIKPRDSNGCIVMNNDDIEMLSRYIQLNRTPIIVAERLEMVPANSQLEHNKSLTSFLNRWRTAFVQGDWASFSACYREPDEDLNALWRVWDWIRTTWQHEKIAFDMSFQNLALMQANPCVVALFDQVIHLDRQVTVVGTKKLFLEKKGESWKIVGEVYQPSDSNQAANQPLVTALNHLGRAHVDQREIADLVAEWADAWSSKDIQRYRACYAPDFQAKEMDLMAWMRHKESLNRQYQWIHVGIEDLKIEQGPDTSTATFLQKYISSGYQAVGTKRLQLKRIGGAWKIHRETWHSTHK